MGSAKCIDLFSLLQKILYRSRVTHSNNIIAKDRCLSIAFSVTSPRNTGKSSECPVRISKIIFKTAPRLVGEAKILSKTASLTSIVQGCVSCSGSGVNDLQDNSHKQLTTSKTPAGGYSVPVLKSCFRFLVKIRTLDSWVLVVEAQWGTRYSDLTLDIFMDIEV